MELVLQLRFAVSQTFLNNDGISGKVAGLGLALAFACISMAGEHQ
jgi:hypothetical protein